MAGTEVSVALLGGFALSVDHRTVPLVHSAQRLVAFLTLINRPVRREPLAEVLWPGCGQRRAAANLRSSLWRMRQSCAELLDAGERLVVLRPDVVVDVWRAAGEARRMLADPAPADDTITGHLRDDLSADVLPDWSDEWVLAERERYRQLRLHALDMMCELLTRSGRYGEAIDIGLVAVRAEPLRESAHRALVRAHLAEGNVAEAIRQYNRCRRVLHDELGIEPSPRLRELLVAIRR
ncbi:hypothetical protein Ait01nite_081930 [Actinoplanes italicus]|uniref:DNA-binding SARP family transcriptional activator n=1 Tax=Actinoplanes italicus TaxID=113567 RepID=A0A2T0K383_9ACTN|nr:BTAD domain-containing putative transcriptional regulator [Actinoplanes italicus]PRX17295.1 DNA-binding SARP family transcriptional activator [Actinoplanes italicus]GIE35148.1 hypothetical protein Ait01nite_081930 [Actinoplanes italicus]